MRGRTLPANSRRWEILANVHLKPTAEGGRKGPTPRGQYRCALRLSREDACYWDCAMWFDTPLAPGESSTVPFVFLSPLDVLPRLRVGSRFELWEGGIIGWAEVTRVAGEG